MWIAGWVGDPPIRGEYQSSTPRNVNLLPGSPNPPILPNLPEPTDTAKSRQSLGKSQPEAKVTVLFPALVPSASPGMVLVFRSLGSPTVLVLLAAGLCLPDDRRCAGGEPHY